MANVTLKVCSKCKVPKPATKTNFAKHRGKPDGLQGECKPCRKLLVRPQLKAYKEASEAKATKAKQPWTPEADKVANDRSLTILEAAALLGRSYAAVAHRRNVLGVQ